MKEIFTNIMTEENYLGIIPARGGSKGVERKNIKSLAGRPLIAHTIEAASNADELDRTIVTTDDPEIRQVAQENGGDAPFLRPQELATDEAPMAPVVEHAVSYLENEEEYTCSAAVLLQPTAPLRKATHIDRAIEHHREPGITTVISTFEDHSYRWQPRETDAKQLNYTSEVSRRQDKTPEYVENGAIYIVDIEEFLSEGNLRGGTVGLFEMPRRRSIDIDTEFDFWLAEQFVKHFEAED
jgi:CMP-N-acetylneuraminic acid synthetase